MSCYIIATTQEWDTDLPSVLEKKANEKIIYINNKDKLSLKLLEELRPKYLFFIHWSEIIPANIHENFECVIFHMTDLPFGRGGSPLQNLIARGIYETQITALRCQKGLDTGPVYMKVPFSLYGSAEEIYLRASKVIEKMILHIIEFEPIPIEQQGEVTVFSRRKPSESDISKLKDINQVFDYIRMLDAEGYPKAFLETEYLRIEFTRAALKKDGVVADVKITTREG